MERAVIVGATSGIGREVAQILLKKGWHVGIAGRREDILRQMKALQPQAIEYQVIDVTSEDAPGRLQDLINKLGGMDLYLHCSGYGRINPDLDPSIDTKVVQTNITGFVVMANYAFRFFKEQKGGHLAAVTSIAGRRGMGLNAAYSSSKRFQMAYLSSLAQLSHNGKYNVRITDIQPGFVKTDFLQHSYPMMMKTPYVAGKIVRGLCKGKRFIVIDWRYRIVACVWHMIPHWIWERINLQAFVSW